MKNTMERKGKLENLGRSFDLKFWQKRPPQARFDATRSLVNARIAPREKVFANSDFTESVENFQRQQVKYLITGDYTIVQHAEPRYTKDLDMWVNTDRQNTEAVYQSLQAFGAPLASMLVDDFAEEGYFYQLGAPPIRVNILMGMPDPDFGDAWLRRMRVNNKTQEVLRHEQRNRWRQ